MIIEYKYYPAVEIATEIQRKLKVHFEICYIKFCINFTITPFHPATRIHEAEGGELEVEAQEIMYATTAQEPEIPIMLTKEQKFIIGDLVDYNVLDEACYNAWDSRDTADWSYLYD